MKIIFVLLTILFFSQSIKAQEIALEKELYVFSKKENTVFVTDDIISSAFNSDSKKSSMEDIFVFYNYRYEKQSNIIILHKNIEPEKDTPIFNRSELSFILKYLRYDNIDRGEYTNLLSKKIISEHQNQSKEKDVFLFPVNELSTEDKDQIMRMVNFLSLIDIARYHSLMQVLFTNIDNNKVIFQNLDFPNLNFIGFGYSAVYPSKIKSTKMILSDGFCPTLMARSSYAGQGISLSTVRTIFSFRYSYGV
jgi:hypothetical protein